MRERQPDGADLLPAWQQTIDDPPRDDEVRARVVVGERQAEAEVVAGGGGAGERDARGDDGGKAARRNVNGAGRGRTIRV
ncbi:MAG: hypothetical protein DMF85_13025 [Acidobacteria bacterium]|nr:MAG: hypothetical protein DMF85_13025 [Acidobacteriota bacterium]PYR78105.1 MAG: hypothetical protein DMF86_06980 [Acidobacteriota bacterium]